MPQSTVRRHSTGAPVLPAGAPLGGNGSDSVEKGRMKKNSVDMSFQQQPQQQQQQHGGRGRGRGGPGRGGGGQHRPGAPNKVFSHKHSDSQLLPGPQHPQQQQQHTGKHYSMLGSNSSLASVGLGVGGGVLPSSASELHLHQLHQQQQHWRRQQQQLQNNNWVRQQQLHQQQQQQHHPLPGEYYQMRSRSSSQLSISGQWTLGQRRLSCPKINGGGGGSGYRSSGSSAEDLRDWQNNMFLGMRRRRSRGKSWSGYYIGGGGECKCHTPQQQQQQQHTTRQLLPELLLPLLHLHPLLLLLLPLASSSPSSSSSSSSSTPSSSSCWHTERLSRFLFMVNCLLGPRLHCLNYLITRLLIFIFYLFLLHYYLVT